jgi:RHS repeat-associated protein
MTRPDTGIKTLLLTFAAIAWLTAGAHPLQAQTAPFTQCPAVGGATSCQALVVMSNSGVSVLTDLNAPVFGDGEDALIGVQNNSTGTVSSITLQGPGLFGFDGDGLCDTLPAPNGCPFGPTHYEGPGVSFNSVDGNTGTVTFTPALAPGATAYFTLEATPDAISAPPVITSFAPPSASSGQAAFTLTIQGANFGTGATVLWTSPSNPATTLIPISVSTTQIVVNVTAALVANAGTAQVAVAVGAQTSASASFPILGLAIITTQLPAGVVGSPYSGATLQAVGGTMPYLWGWGAGTPPGLSLDTNTGAISGTPTAIGTYQFPVNVTDASNKIATGALTIVVTPLPGTFGPTDTTTNPTGSFAEPVNTATGNYYSSQTDLSLRGRGLDFVFNRYYNSLDSYSGPLGFGWSHSYNISLTVAAGTGIVTVKEATGGTLTFNPVTGGYMAATPGCHDTLVKIGSSFVLTRKNRTRIAFSSSGALDSVTDRNGNQQTMTRSAAGDLTSITYGIGRSVTLAYDSSHRITSITDPGNRVIRYSYDVSGNLASVTDAAGGITRYSYDSAHRMRTGVDPRNVTYLQNIYDANGRVTNQVNGVGATTLFAYNTPAAGVTTITDANGNKLQHIYDASLRLVQTIDGSGGKTAFAYDANNNRTSMTDANGHVTTLTWDFDGNVTRIKDAAGNTTQVAYDFNSNPTQIIDPAGHTTVLTYDLNSNNLETVQDAVGTSIYIDDAFGELTAFTDAEGNSIQYFWDTVGDLTQIIDGAGRIRYMAYDNVGRLVSSSDQSQDTTKYQYDNLDRVIFITDPLGLQTQFVWDAMHDVTSVIDANGKSTAYTYDGVHNLVRVTDALGQQTQFVYDGNNNRITYTNARGKSRSYSYDAANRLTAITDPLGRKTSRTFDAAGNVVSVTDGNKATNVYTYDALNRLEGIRYADGTSMSQSFDSDGNRVSLTDRHGATAYAYDAVNRLTKITRFDGVSVSYGYDRIGRRTSITYPDGRGISYQYDGASNLTKVTDWNNQSTSYSYDQANKLQSLTMPGPLTTQFNVDAANRLTGVTTFTGTLPAQTMLSSFGYSLDNVGNRLQVYFSGPPAPFNADLHTNTKYAYDALYRLTSVTDATGQTVQYNYDAVGNRTRVTSPTQSLFYTYDDADEMLTGGGNAYGYDGNGSLISKLTPAGSTAYSWNSARRLVSVSGNGGTVQYDYDADGNRLSQQSAAGTYNYVTDPARVPSAVLSEQGPDGPIAYQYGRALIGLNNAAGTQYVGSDGIGSIVNVVSNSGALQGNYSYDAWGVSQTPLDPLGTKEKFKWAGEAFDNATGLYYLRARYYDPSTGRFLSRDPLGTDQNPYSYARNNPLLFVDPNGLAAEPAPQADATSPPSCAAGSIAGFSIPCFGVGLVQGGTAFGGVANVNPHGAAFTAGSGEGIFFGPGGITGSSFKQIGGFAGESALASEGMPDKARGFAAGASVGIFISNAPNIQEVKGPSPTLIMDLGPVEFQFNRSGDSWMLSITGGLGWGLGYSVLTTDTIPTRPPILF